MEKLKKKASKLILVPHYLLFGPKLLIDEYEPLTASVVMGNRYLHLQNFLRNNEINSVFSFFSFSKKSDTSNKELLCK